MATIADVIEPNVQSIGSRDAFARDVLQGLSRRQKSLSSAWFYDQRGSQLFEEITRLDEYYLTRCEREILTMHATDIAESLRGEPCRVLEIGAGDGHKTEILLQEFVAQGMEVEYVPIDICQRSIVQLTAKLRRTIGGTFAVHGIVAEYQDALDSLSAHSGVRNLVLFLGSSIGNFHPAAARRFLRRLRRTLRAGDQALIGFDLVKDPSVLQRAYDDATGVTREFNLNLLDRMNRELGAEFARDKFLHHATYNPAHRCMESWLVSRQRQTVLIAALQRSFQFAAWEAIRVERSFKYDLQSIAVLAAASGFHVSRHFLDRQRSFVDSLWIAE